MRYFKNPKWLRFLYPDAIWDFSFLQEKVIYLTFDDGPDVETTPWLLDLLKQYKAPSTFFCLGKNIEAEPELIERSKAEGHLICNHSYSHPNGLKTPHDDYVNNMLKGAEITGSKLYRPPYGKIKTTQYKTLRKKHGFKAVFWSVLTYDFDASLDREHRLNMVRKLTHPGAVLVFHDSKKAFPQLKQELPLLLEEWTSQGYSFKSIENL
jgi:peptidoglycan/xylan/chitin deacetylase (PgdA/CDA1 family)